MHGGSNATPCNCLRRNAPRLVSSEADRDRPEGSWIHGRSTSSAIADVVGRGTSSKRPAPSKARRGDPAGSASAFALCRSAYSRCRTAYRLRLENRRVLTSLVGSNPTLSAKLQTSVIAHTVRITPHPCCRTGSGGKYHRLGDRHGLLVSWSSPEWVNAQTACAQMWPTRSE